MRAFLLKRHKKIQEVFLFSSYIVARGLSTSRTKGEDYRVVGSTFSPPMFFITTIIINVWRIPQLRHSTNRVENLCASEELELEFSLLDSSRQTAAILRD